VEKGKKRRRGKKKKEEERERSGVFGSQATKIEEEEAALKIPNIRSSSDYSTDRGQGKKFAIPVPLLFHRYPDRVLFLVTIVAKGKRVFSPSSVSQLDANMERRRGKKGEERGGWLLLSYAMFVKRRGEEDAVAVDRI